MTWGLVLGKFMPFMGYTGRKGRAGDSLS